MKRFTFILAIACVYTQASAATPSLKDAYANDFLIGVALDGDLPRDFSAAELGTIESQFNAITPENCMKAAAIHPAEDRWDFARADLLVKFAGDYQMEVFGHTLVWDQQTPDWFFKDGEKPASREKVLARLKNHIQTIVGRYSGKVRGWDVVNEALPRKGDDALGPSPWRTALGDDYLVDAYRFAHEADPNAQLQYNDFDIESEPKRSKAIRLIRHLQEAGIPIAAVGIQGHWILDQVPYHDIDVAIEQFHALGIKVNISELDLDVLPRHRSTDLLHVKSGDDLVTAATRPVPDLLALQAEQYARLFAIFHKHRDAISRVTFWGLDDGRSWLNFLRNKSRTDYPLLFDRQCLPKPAFDAVIDVMREPATRP